MEDKAKIEGLHHITALASGSQQNVDFYTGVLGMRLVKKTVNFDAPNVYHFYYGDETGTPGSILTFFPFKDLVRGRKGPGQLTTTSFSVAEEGKAYWQERLARFDIPTEEKTLPDGNQALYFEDFDGLGLQLVFNGQDPRLGHRRGPVPIEYSLKGIYGVELCYHSLWGSRQFIEKHLGLKEAAHFGDDHIRYSTSGNPYGFLDIVAQPDSPPGLQGAGTVHHLAFAVEDEEQQMSAHRQLERSSRQASQPYDRQYFKSIYFREPGGVLFELATLGPGFLVDESEEELGTSLKLPPWMDSHRASIEKALQPVAPKTETYV